MVRCVWNLSFPGGAEEERKGRPPSILHTSQDREPGTQLPGTHRLEASRLSWRDAIAHVNSIKQRLPRP